MQKTCRRKMIVSGSNSIVRVEEYVGPATGFTDHRVLRPEGRLYVLEFSMQPEEEGKKRAGCLGASEGIYPLRAAAAGMAGTGRKTAYVVAGHYRNVSASPAIRDEMTEAGFKDVTYAVFPVWRYV